jgi:hypothetical protein
MSGRMEEKGNRRDASEENEDRDMQTLEYSGIQERKGRVNAWLIVVYVAVTVWSVWYLITYWTKS